MWVLGAAVGSALALQVTPKPTSNPCTWATTAPMVNPTVSWGCRARVDSLGLVLGLWLWLWLVLVLVLMLVLVLVLVHGKDNGKGKERKSHEVTMRAFLTSCLRRWGGL